MFLQICTSGDEALPVENGFYRSVETLRHPKSEFSDFRRGWKPRPFKATRISKCRTSSKRAVP
jgi:hypothetical protein